MKKKILLIGNNWYGNIEKYFYNAFKILGYDCHLLYYPRNTDIYIIRKLHKIKFHKIFSDKIWINFLEKIKKKEFIIHLKKQLKNIYDFIFIFKGDFVDLEIINILKATNSKLGIYFYDNPFFFIEHSNLTVINNVLQTLKFYDFIFIFDSYYIPLLKRIVNENICFLPLAYDETQYYPINNSQNKKYDISFVASATQYRKYFLDNIKLENINLFGPGWNTNNYKNAKDRIFTTDEIIKIYSQSKINLNINNQNSIYGVNSKTFEIIGSGNFLLTDYKKDIDDLFTINKEIICYENKDDLKKKIKFYLNNEQAYNKIIKNGLLRAKKEHRYVHRALKVLKFIER